MGDGGGRGTGRREGRERGEGYYQNKYDDHGKKGEVDTIMEETECAYSKVRDPNNSY